MKKLSMILSLLFATQLLFAQAVINKNSYNKQQNSTTLNAAALPSIKIGKQVWTTKNLNVSRYRNGDVIPQVTDPTEWLNLTTGAWCYYDNDAANGATYGKLYNWYAVNDARGLAPQGYHVPSDAEWTTLTTFLGGEEVAGGKMKSTGTPLWVAPNKKATNSSGFAGLPGGGRGVDGTFGNVGSGGGWWSSTEANTTFGSAACTTTVALFTETAALSVWGFRFVALGIRSVSKVRWG